MLARSFHNNSRVLQRWSVRSITTTIVNPAKMIDPYLAHSPVLPFGMDFVEPRLRAALESRGVDVDKVERLMFEQVRNDHEFNNPALPREGSALWPYSYGEWLVKSRVRLNTLAPEEQYLSNYLRTLTDELEKRMDTKYPSYDWRAVAAQSQSAVEQPINEAFEDCYAEATADIIARDPQAYVAYYKNNAFIDCYDEDDKFKDFLPRELEATLAKRFEFAWDHASPNADPSKYFDSMKQLDSAVSVPIDALSADLRKAFYAMLLDMFGWKKTQMLREFVDAVNSATSAVKVDIDGKRADALVDEIFDILELSNASSLEGQGAKIAANMLFGPKSLSEISGQPISEVKQRAASLPEQDLVLLREVLEIVKYLKSNSAARLVLAVACSMNPSLFGQLLTSEDAMNAFLEGTVPAMEEAAMAQRQVYSANKDVASALDAFFIAVAGASNLSAGSMSEFGAFLKNEGLVALASGISFGDAFPVVAGFQAAAASAKADGLVEREAYASAQAVYLSSPSNVAQCWPACLAAYALNPPLNGYKSSLFYKIPRSVGSNGSEASSAFFAAVQQYLNSLGVDKSVISGLQSAVSTEFAALSEACKESEKALDARDAELAKLQFDFDGKFDFDRVREKYNPFDIHISMYNYHQQH